MSSKHYTEETMRRNEHREHPRGLADLLLAHALIEDGHGSVAGIRQKRRGFKREVFVELEAHQATLGVAGTKRSRANSAA